MKVYVITQDHFRKKGGDFNRYGIDSVFYYTIESVYGSEEEALERMSVIASALKEKNKGKSYSVWEDRPDFFTLDNYEERFSFQIHCEDLK